MYQGIFLDVSKMLKEIYILIRKRSLKKHTKVDQQDVEI
jgi:hypothetical protein